MLMEARVSVVIPLYNHADWVVGAVRSALDQTYPPIEVIVVDDGSTDHGSAGLEDLADEVHVMHQMNAGVAMARNRGAATAVGSHVAFLDSDDTWYPQKLELQLQALDSLPGACVAHCGLEVVDDVGHVVSTRVEGASGSSAEDLFLQKRWMGTGSTDLVHLEVFRSLGGFDSNLSCSADWDLNLRLAELGPVAFVPLPLVRYRDSDAGMHRDVDLMCSDMMAAVTKALARDPDRYFGLVRPSLARIHLMVSGSYLHSGRLLQAVTHLGRAALWDPSALLYALGIIRRRRQV